jgi:hypothetical protein
MKMINTMHTHRSDITTKHAGKSCVLTVTPFGASVLMLAATLFLGTPAWSQTAPLLDQNGRVSGAQGATRAATPMQVVTVTPGVPAAPPQVMPPAAPAPRPRPLNRDDLGRDTRELLAMQSSGVQAGKPLPMLGAEVSNAYKRYLDSFSLPIPKFFDQAVSTKSSGTSQ